MAENTNKEQEKLPVLVRKFEIAVYDKDLQDDGSIQYKQIAYQKPLIIEATSPKELQDKLATFKECDQVAKVIREIDPPSKEQIQKMLGINENNKQEKEPVVEQKKQLANYENITNSVVKIVQKTQDVRPIRYYKVGDVDIKDDNGKIYQKQWMRLTDSEAANIRIVNDKNNSIVNLNGKHIELKKWVLVESSENNDISIEGDM